MVGVIVRAHDDDAVATDLASNEMEHLERRAVRPLQILQHDQHRTLGREPRQELRQVPEQPSLQLRRVAAGNRGRLSTVLESGKELDQFRRSASREESEHRRLDGTQQRQQRVGEHGVRNTRLDGVCATDGDGEPALACLLDERFDEVRLSNAALTNEEERSPRSGVGVAQRRGERREVRRASDERRRGGRLR